MIRSFLFLIAFSTLFLHADIQKDLQKHLPDILEKVEEVEGKFLRVQPFPNQGGSFINSVYLVTTTAGEEFALKVENPNWKNKKTLNEILSIKFLTEHTLIPVPHILLFENNLEVSPFQAEYILMNRLEGKPLNHEIDKIYRDRELYITLLSNLADILAELKSIQFQSLGNFSYEDGLSIRGIIDFHNYNCNESIESFSQYAGHWLNYYYREMQQLSFEGHPNGKLFEKYLPTIKQWLACMDLTFLDQPNDFFVYSHQDFVMKNILVDGAKVTGILDWEWSGSALPEFEQKTGLDFLFTNEDRALFSSLLRERGVHDFFELPSNNRELFYRLVGNIYALISCYEWIEGKLEHTAKFLDQKLEQRMVKNDENFDMDAYIEEKIKDLDFCIKKFEIIWRDSK